MPDSIPLSFQSDAATGSTKPVGPGATTGPGEAGPGSGAGPVLQFFTRLRRHASLDGASPYFKVKKWKLDPSQRASSLDTRGELWPSVETGALRVELQLPGAVPGSLREEGSAPKEESVLLRGPGPLPMLASRTHLPVGISPKGLQLVGSHTVPQ